MLIPSVTRQSRFRIASLSRRVNANSQHGMREELAAHKLIKKGEC